MSVGPKNLGDQYMSGLRASKVGRLVLVVVAPMVSSLWTYSGRLRGVAISRSIWKSAYLDESECVSHRVSYRPETETQT
jgi:hypothetical protein